MPKWCRLNNGRVIEVISFNPDGLYHPSLSWQQCPDETVQGSFIDAEGAWVHPEAEPDPEP